MTAETSVCARCQGAGKIRIDEDHLDANGDLHGIADYMNERHGNG